MTSYDLAGKSVYVAGHKGMVGSAIVRRLERESCTILTAPRGVDLREQASVRDWFAANRPDVVVIAAAKVVVAPPPNPVRLSPAADAAAAGKGRTAPG